MKREAGRGFVPVLHGATEASADEIDQLIAAEAVAAALVTRGFTTEVIGLGLDLRALQELAPKRPLVAFNLVDALAGEARLSATVPVLLERLKVPFTGASAAAYLDTLSKLAMKQAIDAACLPTAEWSECGLGLPEDELAIVKPVFEHGSLGLDDSSVVPGRKAAELIEQRNQRYHTPHFAEVFVEGREFNVSLLQRTGKVEVLPIAEILFQTPGEGVHIVGYAAKWSPDHPTYEGTPRRFGLEDEEPNLAHQLKTLALRCWALFGLSGYARVDFRVSSHGEPYILEVNANPCLSPDAGFAASARQIGLSYDRLIEAILHASFGGVTANA